jgi:hypothetical protein
MPAAMFRSSRLSTANLGSLVLLTFLAQKVSARICTAKSGSTFVLQKVAPHAKVEYRKTGSPMQKAAPLSGEPLILNIKGTSTGWQNTVPDD